ncbi:MAG: hypothetical protein F3743_12335 [Nitrospinae bacterium]|nr:hypothetical protein [Nitrospinota bacterium]
MHPIAAYKNLHSDKKLFIMASGPSLADLDLSLLKNKMVMGLNRSILIYPNTYYQCVFDHRLFNLYAEEFKKVRQLFTLEDRPIGLPLKLLGEKGSAMTLKKEFIPGIPFPILLSRLPPIWDLKKYSIFGWT